ncbi:hypothetical protein SAMN05421823_111222 [Catalinimonas alkaloidigena]|uniref:Zinc-ribbon domain-containing protein n=1 Tax=Catalinimonas alkaloidigena TaxID=1075417 RepID=A0A1G9RPQ8_9BACT|nr:putative zinc-binding peptidase [Catalinimonas alkaloidigena]SDM25050.1 hypothetical protein SAMN05421823_111222 [Catalinimonas alkaloidigena]
MQLFKCTHCGQLLYFENHHCEKCGYPLGFEPEKLKLVPLVPVHDAVFEIYENGPETYRYCDNHQHGVCNWLVPTDSPSAYCKACELNRTVPDLSNPDYVARWQTLEFAKHRLVYALLRMKLPLISKFQDPDKGLAFDFLANPTEEGAPRVLTGHADGLITINIEEADDLEREMARKNMDEAYRTVLGHFRHEVGHYYWDRLIADDGRQEAFRALFGDEQADYGEALEKHYETGPPDHWQEEYISAYATTHPWEDWAETWAHYLHIVDTLETAYSFGMSVSPIVADEADDSLEADMDRDPYRLKKFDGLINRWLPLTFAMNSLNRSMGHHDLYPFVIPPKVVEKLAFVHDVCKEVKREARETSKVAP